MISRLKWPAAPLLLLATSFGCTPSEKPMRFGSPQPEAVSAHSAHANMQGMTKSEGLQIYWAGLTSEGASTLDVVNATIGRIQFEQSTNELASDSNAKVLAHLMQARRELEGKSTTTEDGLPILD